MKNSIGAAALTVAALAGPANAAGTQQGTTITNNVTVSYQVGGVSQNAVTASDSFVVDRKINLTVSEAGGAATSVSPGQAGAVTVFTVTNSSNDTVDLGLSAFQQTGGGALRRHRHVRRDRRPDLSRDQQCRRAADRPRRRYGRHLPR